MGTNVIRFPARRHARASSSSSVIFERASKVISERPRSEASRDKDGKRFEGMPRVRQTLTPAFDKESASATALVPPRASMTESGVSMEANVVCMVQTCQGFANRKTTFVEECGAIGGMIDPPLIVAGRLEALRKELKIEKDQEFAEAIGLDKSTYSLIKNGHRNLSFETACLMRHKWGLSIDWIFYGDIQQNAMQIMARIGRGDPLPGPAPKKAKPAKRKAG